MKSILIISQHIFPKQTPRAHRATELAIEFSKQGYEVTVYAVLGNYDYNLFQKKHNLKIKNIKLSWQYEPYSSDFKVRRYFVDKVLGRLLHNFFEFPNIEFYFKIPQIIKKEIFFDILISIAEPHTIHWGCAKAKYKYPEKFPKKWIADCGDPYYNNGNSNIYKSKFKNMEHFFCKNVDFITVPIPSAINGYFNVYKNKIKVIPQGFRFPKIEPKYLKKSEKFPIFAYCGNFFKDYRDPTKFFEMLMKVELNFKFIIFTNHISLIKKFIPQLREKIEIRAIIPRKEMLNEIKKMDFLINFENKNLPGQLPSKLIDYAIVSRPILNINPEIIEPNIFIEFLKGDYKKQYIVDNINDFRIENVIKKFEKLIKD